MIWRESLADLVLRAKGNKPDKMRHDADWLLFVVDRWRVVLGIPSVFE